MNDWSALDGAVFLFFLIVGVVMVVGLFIEHRSETKGMREYLSERERQRRSGKWD